MSQNREETAEGLQIKADFDDNLKYNDSICDVNDIQNIKFLSCQ